jgi:PP-loop superfamily ATP-utilizing enzyme
MEQTPKEKAEELVRKFKPLVTFSMGVDPSYVLKVAKKCALVSVDEILQMVDETMQGWLDADIIAHWKQVKQEIEKL